MTDHHAYSSQTISQNHTQTERKHQKIAIPKSQAKIVNDQEMILLQIEAASKIFHQHIRKQNQQLLQPDFGSNSKSESSQEDTLKVFKQEYFDCKYEERSSNHKNREQQSILEKEIQRFISIFMQCFQVGTEIVVAALIYIERLMKINQNITLTEDNAKGLLHTSLAIAAKFNADLFERNTIFHAIGGLSRNAMRKMTDLFLDLIQFDLVISDEEFSQFMSNLKKEIAKKFQQLGQIVILERSIRKKSAGSGNSDSGQTKRNNFKSFTNQQQHNVSKFKSLDNDLERQSHSPHDNHDSGSSNNQLSSGETNCDTDTKSDSESVQSSESNGLGVNHYIQGYGYGFSKDKQIETHTYHKIVHVSSNTKDSSMKDSKCSIF